MAQQAQQVNISQLPPASLLYNGDVFVVDQIGGDGYTKKVKFTTLYTSISSIILPELYNIKVNKSGDTMTGHLTLTGSPINALDAATKQYVDTAGFLSKTGGTMTGYLELTGNPINALDAATKQYVDTVTGTNLEDIWLYIMERTYPVGEIFITRQSGNPSLSSILGFGTWERYAEGRVLVGYNAADSDFNGLDVTGGAKTHVLTEAEIPPHRHQLPYNPNNHQGGGSAQDSGEGTSNYTNSNLTNFTGGGQAHNNLQPYITVYMWERVG